MEEQIRREPTYPDIATLALLGSIHREQAKKAGFNLDGVFERCMKDASNIEDPVDRVQTALSNYTWEVLKTMPLLNRCNFILNKLSNAEDDKIDESQLNWEKINKMLFDEPLPYDYNLCKSVHTIKDIRELWMSINESSILGGPWYTQRCKTCKETFTLSLDEITFYAKKELNVPKRCKNCIMESKGQESYRQRKQREDKEREEVRKALLPEDNRTAMEIAFENAKKQKKGN